MNSISIEAGPAMPIVRMFQISRLTNKFITSRHSSMEPADLQALLIFSSPGVGTKTFLPFGEYIQLLYTKVRSSCQPYLLGTLIAALLALATSTQARMYSNKFLSLPEPKAAIMFCAANALTVSSLLTTARCGSRISTTPSGLKAFMCTLCSPLRLRISTTNKSYGNSRTCLRDLEPLSSSMILSM